MDDQEFYWELILKNDESIQVKPDAVRAVQQAIANKQVITTPTRSIVYSEIKDFRITDKIYTEQKLLEDVSRAFNEPIYTEDGSVKARYVKKSVPIRKWNTHYSAHPAYHKLYETDSYVVIAFMLPVHQIDHDFVQELTPDEERSLSKRID